MSLWIIDGWFLIAHISYINVEICSSVKAIKYIHKYIFKDNDRITVQLQQENDEVAHHPNERYIGPTQAAWNLLEYRNH